MLSMHNAGVCNRNGNKRRNRADTGPRILPPRPPFSIRHLLPVFLSYVIAALPCLQRAFTASMYPQPCQRFFRRFNDLSRFSRNNSAFCVSQFEKKIAFATGLPFLLLRLVSEELGRVRKNSSHDEAHTWFEKLKTNYNILKRYLYAQCLSCNIYTI